MAPGDTARLYHRLSSYAGAPDDEWPTPIDHPLVRQDFAPNHRPTFPAHRKVYPDSLPTVELPAAWPPVHAPTLDLLAGRHASVARELDLEGLARLLHLSAGVVRVAVRRDGRRFLFRPAGSAGGLFPLELYVAARGVSGLRDGVYWYDPRGTLAAPGGPRACRRRNDHRGDGDPVADGVAVRGARVPPHLLGRRHDAREHARARRSGRLSARAPDPLSRRGRRTAGRCRRDAGVPARHRDPRPRRARDRPRRRGGNRRPSTWHRSSSRS